MLVKGHTMAFLLECLDLSGDLEQWELGEPQSLILTAEPSRQTAAAHTRPPRHQTTELTSARHSVMMLSGQSVGLNVGLTG